MATKQKQAKQKQARASAKSSRAVTRRLPAKRGKSAILGKCMVLMPFEDPFNAYYSSIFEPAVNSARLEPVRGDSLFRPSPIMADIWQLIQDARVLIAELTGRNANVFYELGLAHALSKPVVLVAENIADVPFDLQPLRVILYNKADPAWGRKLAASLTKALKETLAERVRSVPEMFRKRTKSQAPVGSGIAERLATLERQVASLTRATGVPFLTTGSINLTGSESPFQVGENMVRFRP